MHINNNHSNLAFDREINNSQAVLQAKVFDTCGYTSEMLLERLMQRLVEIGLCSYSLAVSILCKTSSNYFPAPGTQINCGRVSMEMGSGKLTFTAKQLIANQLDFLLHWTLCLIAILAVKNTKDNLPAVLVFGVAEESIFIEKSDEQFVNYCRFGPITPLRNGKRIIVQSASKNPSSCQPSFTYSRMPLIELLRGARMGIFGRFRLLVNHLILFFSYMSAVFQLPQLSLLGRDFAYSSISFELDRRRLIESIVLTISSYARQPLWGRALHHAKVHMVWYAHNFKPIVYAVDKMESDIPNLRWIRVDTHWVWTHAFAKYLKNLCHPNTIEVVGPIVWYLPKINIPETNTISIVIFDISPFNDEVALGGGEITNYNHPNNLFSFIQDIISLKLEIEKYFNLPVSFRLKTKRGYNAVYDRAYFDYIGDLNSSGYISLEHYSTNVYSLISQSHLVISYPFTSTAYIAESLGVPSIYYDPTNSIVGHHFGDSQSLINFSGSPKELINAAISALKQSFRK